MKRAPCPRCGHSVAITRLGEVYRGHRCRETSAPKPAEPPEPPAPEGMAWCGVCELAVTVLEDGRLNGHGVHGHACAGSWAAVLS